MDPLEGLPGPWLERIGPMGRAVLVFNFAALGTFRPPETASGPMRHFISIALLAALPRSPQQPIIPTGPIRSTPRRRRTIISCSSRCRAAARPIPRRRSTIPSILQTGFPTSIRRCRRRWRRHEARRARLRPVPSAERRRPSGILEPRRPAGALPDAADGGVQERPPQGGARHHDGHDCAGDLGRRRARRQRILRVAQARHLHQGGRDRHGAEKLCRRRRHALRRAGRREGADRQPHHRAAAGRGAREAA